MKRTQQRSFTCDGDGVSLLVLVEITAGIEGEACEGESEGVQKSRRPTRPARQSSWIWHEVASPLRQTKADLAI